MDKHGNSLQVRVARGTIGTLLLLLLTLLLLLLVSTSPVLAGTTTTYTYDALGRLRVVSKSGDQVGTQTYEYDPAGNRGQFTTSRAGVPTSISVPASSSTGSYTISWVAASGGGAGISFELYEASNSAFSGQVNVHTGSATSKSITGKSSGTYYYRVRACDGPLCSGYLAGANSIDVNVTPSQPPSISVPSGSTNTTGSYTISWGASTSGVVNAYELYEATNPGFSGQVNVYSGLNTSKLISGKVDGGYYYRVRACNTSVDCSVYQFWGSPVTVRLPPSAPASISVPSSSSTGSYTVVWGNASTGTVTAYQLFEATNSSFTGETLIQEGLGTTKGVSGKTDGTYYYRVRACNTPASCSGYAPGPNVVTVTLPPATPSIPLNLRKSPATGTGSIYTILWDASSGPVSYYILEQSANGGSFNPFPQINHPTTSKSFNQGCGEYRYRVKACSSAGACSAYSNSITKRVCNN